MSDPFAALTGLRAAYNIAKTMHGMMEEAKVNEVRLALQEALLDAQEKLRDGRDELDAKNKEVADLKAEIERLKDWSAERANFRLTQVTFNGVHVYIPANFSGRFETALKLCANCFDKGNRSILQDNFPGNRDTGRRHVLVCPNGCASITFERYMEPTPAVE